MAQRGIHVGVAQHARQLARARVSPHHLNVAGRHAALRPLRHDELVIGVGGDLRQVRDHERLSPAANARERLTPPPPPPPPPPPRPPPPHPRGGPRPRPGAPPSRGEEAGRTPPPGGAAPGGGGGDD